CFYHISGFKIRLSLRNIFNQNQTVTLLDFMSKFFVRQSGTNA
ncbi:MAG: hypothetical protein ACI8X3_003495, partial [Saprospiraceae bacterium]